MQLWPRRLLHGPPNLTYEVNSVPITIAGSLCLQHWQRRKGGQMKTTKWWKWRWNTSQVPLFSYFLLFPSPSGLMKPNPLKIFRNILFSNQVIQQLIWSNFAVTAVVTSYFSRFLKCWFMSNYTSAHMLTFSANTERLNFEGNTAI